MIKNIAIGLVAGAVAIVALIFSRPRMLAVHPFNTVEVRIDGLAPLPTGPQAWEMGLPPTTLPASRPATRPGPSPLDRVVDEVNFAAVPLWQALDGLGTKLDANVVVNWKALEAVGIDKQAPVTLHLKQVTGQRVLDILLADVGGSAKLAHSWRDGVVLVSTAEELDRHTVTRMYDVRDLMAEAWRFHQRLTPDAPSQQAAPPPLSSSGTGPAVGAGPFTLSGTPATEAELAQQICAIIEENIQPEGWRENGGTIGAIKYWAGRLVIVQTLENHEKVEAILRLLRGQAQ